MDVVDSRDIYDEYKHLFSNKLIKALNLQKLEDVDETDQIWENIRYVGRTIDDKKEVPNAVNYIAGHLEYLASNDYISGHMVKLMYIETLNNKIHVVSYILLQDDGVELLDDESFKDIRLSLEDVS